jgi:glycosyltransferase involved in cell wall biosynthesis
VRVFLVVNEPSYFHYMLALLHAERITIPDKPPRRNAFVPNAIIRALRQVRHSWLFFQTALRSPEPTAFICQTAHYSALIGCRLARLFGRKCKVYLFNFFVNAATVNRPLQTALRILFAQEIGMNVNAANEVEYFRMICPRATIDYYPYCLGRIEGIDPDSIRQEPVIFSGGHTNRDYGIFLNAARQLKDHRFIVACSAASRLEEPIPDNVLVYRDLPWIEFHRHMARSRVVVVPLAADIGSSGQMVALAAMQFGKVVVYSDFPSLNQYFTDGVTGLAFPPRNAETLAHTIERGMELGKHPSTMGALARVEADTTFSRDRYESRLNSHIAEFLGAPRGGE